MNNGVTIKLGSGVLRRLEVVIDQSGLGPWLEDELESSTERGTGTHFGGRRRVLTSHALLVGMLATTWAGQPLILRTVRDVLNALHPSDKHRLGVPSTAEGGVTERHVSYLFGRITALLDPSPHSADNRDRYEHLRDAARDLVRLNLGETAEQDVLQAAMSAAVEQVRTEHQNMAGHQARPTALGPGPRPGRHLACRPAAHRVLRHRRVSPVHLGAAEPCDATTPLAPPGPRRGMERQAVLGPARAHHRMVRVLAPRARPRR